MNVFQITPKGSDASPRGDVRHAFHTDANLIEADGENRNASPAPDTYPRLIP